MNKLWGLLLPFLMITSVWAEEKVSLEEVVITATKTQESVEETTSSVTVINKEEIAKMNVDFVPDVFRKIPDLIVRQNGGPGTQITVFLRGGNPAHTLVMIDGIKVNSPATGSFDFAGIPADTIERIEIVKGPQSTIYGSEAMAGVINIITRKGDGKSRVEFSAEGGSFGTYKPSMTISGGDRHLDYRLTGTYFYSDGFSSARAGEEPDGYKNASVSGKVGIKPSDIFDVEITGSHYYDRIELDDFDFSGKAVDNLYFVQHGYHDLLSARTRLYLFNMWEQVLTASLFDETLRFRDPVISYNNSDIKTSTETIDWQNNLYLSSYYTLTAGVEYRHEKDENKGQFDQDIENNAFYLNNILKLFSESLVLNAGLRHDEYETFGGKTTYRIGAVYALKGADLRIKGSYGTGFRAPSFNELFWPADPLYGGGGNLNLKPEKTNSWEAGIEKDLLNKNVTLSVTYFDQKYDDLISNWPPVNIAKAEIKGIEASAAFKASDNVRITAGYTYLDTEDKDTGKQLPFRPKDKLSVGAEYFVKDFSAVASYVFVSKRFDSLVQRDLGSYSLVNLSGTYRLNNRVSFFTRIDNLFDTKYEEVGGFSTPGFSVFGGIKLTSL